MTDSNSTRLLNSWLTVCFVCAGALGACATQSASVANEEQSLTVEEVLAGTSKPEHYPGFPKVPAPQRLHRRRRDQRRVPAVSRSKRQGLGKPIAQRVHRAASARRPGLRDAQRTRVRLRHRQWRRQCRWDLATHGRPLRPGNLRSGNPGTGGAASRSCDNLTPGRQPLPESGGRLSPLR